MGSKCKIIREKLTFINQLLMATVIVLVFFMGLRMGSNEEVISNLHTIGLEALLITFFIMLGSVTAVTITRKLLKVHKNGRLKSDQQEIILKNFDDTNDAKNENNKGSSKMSLTIMLSIALGLILGHIFISRIFYDYNAFEKHSGNTMVIGISFLLFLVGIDMGLAGTIATSLKKAGFRVLIFPLAVVIGSLAGSLVCVLFIPISSKEALAIGAGFGWYTLAPILISEKGYIIAGAISFMHNVIREFGGIILIPIVAKKFGCIEAAALPGVASMDISLPLIEQICGNEIVIYSFLIGLMQSALVPLLVPLFIGF